jgi:hypothetical protein
MEGVYIYEVTIGTASQEQTAESLPFPPPYYSVKTDLYSIENEGPYATYITKKWTELSFSMDAYLTGNC